MTVLDYFVLLVVTGSIAMGATRGILKSAFSILAALMGLLIAAQVYSSAAVIFSGLVATARAANLLGFVTVFLLALAGGSLLARWLRGGLKRARLGWVDQVLGAGFGLLRGWLVCSVIYLALTAFPIKLEAVERAAFAPVLLEGTRVIAYLTSRDVRERFLNGYAIIQEMWGQKS